MGSLNISSLRNYAEYNGERILKIGQQWSKLLANIECPVFGFMRYCWVKYRPKWRGSLLYYSVASNWQRLWILPRSLNFHVSIIMDTHVPLSRGSITAKWRLLLLPCRCDLEVTGTTWWRKVMAGQPIPPYFVLPQHTYLYVCMLWYY